VRYFSIYFFAKNERGQIFLNIDIYH